MTDSELILELRKLGCPDWLGSKSELEVWFGRYTAIMGERPVPCCVCGQIVDGESEYAVWDEYGLYCDECDMERE